MAITIIRKPQDATPVHNPMPVKLSSSNVTQEQFNIIAEVIHESTTLVRLKVPVNPSGFIEFDIQRHLQDRVGNAFNSNYNGNVFYNVNLYEQYKVLNTFIEVQPHSTGLIYLVSSQTPNYEVGDLINIQTDDVASYNVTAAVEFIVEYIDILTYTLMYQVFVDVPYNGDATGTFSLSNNELNNFLGASFSGCAFDSAFDYEGYISNQSNNTFNKYNLDGNINKRFRTNVPNEWKVDFNTDAKLAFTADLDVYNDSNPLILERIPNTGFISTEEVIDTADIKRGYMNIGPAGFPLWLSATDFTVAIKDSEDQILMGPIKFIIEDICSKYEKITLLFKDSLGSYMPFSFYLVNRHNKNIQRTTYIKDRSFLYPTSPTTYPERGKTTLDTKVTDIFTVNSDWVNQSTSDYLMELFTSPDVYWVKAPNVYIPINITNTSVERKQNINDLIINYTLTFELSNKNAIIK